MIETALDFIRRIYADGLPSNQAIDLLIKRDQENFERGREEEREHWKTICDEVSHNNGNQHPIRTATALGIKLRAEGKIPPWPNEANAQPGERVIFCNVCGPNPETILLPDKFGTMQVFCKACHKSGLKASSSCSELTQPAATELPQKGWMESVSRTIVELQQRVQQLEERTTGQIRYGGPTT